ncbi:MAG: acyl-CoA thioesterase [Prevotella sp.]|nr:acyl-CoA thioesterase [Prevotella sp.]MCM1074984.1 acyl-CoA thioesterase [Ruminococcus sp.]
MPKIKVEDLPSINEFRHHVDLQIRFNDIDILGHLNNTVYFSFYDTGKAYYMEAVEGGQINWQRVESVVANVDCAFINPIFFGTEIEVLTKCEHIGERSFTLFQMITDKKTGQVKSVCRTIMVSIDPETKHSVPMPQKWIKGITAYEGGKL